ncbi:aspartic peptidase domain-containing protein [Lipomyces japonicus]|uniref:aspartic peptidase domain-containing protein n=1 Tax=Lipomyces japonicus TaxID=56871 RepID=UPI0034CD6D70
MSPCRPVSGRVFDTELYWAEAGKDGQVDKVDIWRRGGAVYHPDSVADLNRFRSLLALSLRRYSRTKRELQGNRVVRKAMAVSEKLAPIGDDGSWFADLKLGSPAQSVYFDIDMSSSDFWVESTTSVRGIRFDSSKSQTYFSDNNFVFKDCVGSLDSLAIGADTFKIEFAHCQPPRASVKTLNPSGGMLGLAHSSLTQTSLPHFFETAKESGKLAENLFAIQFKQADDGSATGAILSLGGVPHKVDDPLWASVKTYGFWQVLFKSLMVDGNTILDNIQGVIDVTLPFILAPAEDAHTFYNSISGAQPLSNGFWSYPCFENPKVHIEHAGWLFPFRDTSLGRVKEASGYCVGPIVEADLAGLWVIGEPFLKGVLSVFDFDEKRVGFRTI